VGFAFCGKDEGNPKGIAWFTRISIYVYQGIPCLSWWYAFGIFMYTKYERVGKLLSMS